jgi:ABC-type nitrate/sulfonate/bicarbonate transport system substrate-binding protein
MNTTVRVFCICACGLICSILMGIAKFPAQAAAGKRPLVKIIYSALTASNAPVWIGSDQNLYEKYGLDVQVVHGRGASPIQALAGGTVELGHFAGASVVAANLSGSDLVFVGAQSNYVVLSMWTKKDSSIKTLSDLVGKTIGVSAPGSATHTIARLSLRKAGVSDKDVKFVHHGALPEIFVSLDKGLIDIGMASAPRPGFRELIDLATQEIPFLQGAIIVSRSYLQKERSIVLNFLKAFVESMKMAREKPDMVVAALVKHRRITPDVARGAYRSFVNVWEEVPYVRTDGVQAILDFLPREQAKDVTPERYIDNSLIKELETSGFIKNLYRR